MLGPVTIAARGLRYPGLVDGHYNEPAWFDDTLTVALGLARGTSPGVVVRYTLDGSMPDARSPRYERPLTLAATTDLRARAFGPAGEPVGYDRWMRYELHPIRGDVQGELRAPLSSLWELLSDAAVFTRPPVTIRLSSGRRGVIRYTLDGSAPTSASAEFRAPIVVTDTAAVRARLFSPAGEAMGEEWTQRFERATTPTPPARP